MTDYLQERKIEVMLVHSQKIKIIANSKIKTNKINPKILVELLRVDLISEAYYCPKLLCEAKKVLKSKVSFVELETQIKNKIYSFSHKLNIKRDKEFSELFSKKGKEFLKTLSLGKYTTPVLRKYIKTLEFLDSEIVKTNTNLKDVLEKDEIAKFLERFPGIGYYTTITLSKETRDINRFFSAKHLCSYAKLVFSIFQSEEHVRHGKIKQGNKYIRWLLTEAVPKTITKNKILKAFYEKIKSKKGHNKAKITILRKMLGQIWYLLKTKKEFVDSETGPPVFFSGVHSDINQGSNYH